MENFAIEAPRPIPANHESWGGDTAEFWAELAGRCERQRTPESTPSADLRELGSKLVPGTPKENLSADSIISLPPGDDLWIIGDLHGDLLALYALTRFAENMSQVEGHRALFCFLGDLFDDGPFGHAVLREVLSRLHAAETQGYFVVGNHDLSPGWDAGSNRFTATVAPHDFVDWLNDREPNCAWRELARNAISWFAHAPRALLLQDGTLIAHGGCVHSDRLALLQQPDWRSNPDVMEDLVWLRAHETAKRKIPNRTARGCQFGTENFADFLAALSQVTGTPIRQVIRGHDHVVNRWAAPESYRGRLITLNAMSWRQRDGMGAFVRQPVIARHRADRFPELFQIEIPSEHIIALYGEPQSTCVTSAD